LRFSDCGLKTILCVLGLLGEFCGGSVADQVRQSFVPVDGAWGNATLISIAGGRVTLRDDDIPRSFPLDELVRWGNPVPPRPQPIVALADGGQLVTAADWSGGAAVRLNGDDVVIYSDIWDEVTLPRKLVSGAVFTQRSRPEDREKLVNLIKGKPFFEPSLQGRGKAEEATKFDVVLLTNGDRLTGALKALDRGSMTLSTGGAETTFPLSRVEAIALAQMGTEPSPKPKGSVLVGLKDGSLLYAQAIEADGKKLRVELAGGVKLEGGNVGDIVYLQSLGGRFAYLSDMEPASYKFVPYLSIDWPLERDRNVRGGLLTVEGNRYLKGLGLHSAARVTYKLDGSYQTFKAAVALDDAAQGRGSVVFSLYVDRDGKWSELFKSGTVRGGEAPQHVSVDVGRASAITLTVDYADHGDELDYADWLDARLVR